MEITAAHLAQIMPGAAAAGRLEIWADILLAEMKAHDITTAPRAAMFLANIAEETGELNVHAEASYFTTPWSRIRELFGSTSITEALVAEWKTQGREAFDRAFFNWVYGDAHRLPGYRLGNTQPDDGWRYRGRGPMQLTGRGNYERFFRAIGMPTDTDPDLVLQPEIGARSACHFWQAAGCNEIADTGDFEKAVRRVNGGTLNMAARLHYYGLARSALGLA